MKKIWFVVLMMSLVLQSCNSQPKSVKDTSTTKEVGVIRFPEEKHFGNVMQVTFGGENAEAYWSFNNQLLTFQYTNKSQGVLCDQIYITSGTVFPLSYTYPNELAKEGSSKLSSVGIPPLCPDTAKWNAHHQKKLVSTGKGRTTCSFFLPGDTQILYASTHLGADTCPPSPKHQHGKYLWSIYPEYEIFIADLKGNIVKQLTSNNFYDAEAVVSPKGDKILFTSDRSGDLELYTMNLDGSDVKQITDELGYDGGANFSPDGSQIIWRASHFDVDSERIEYKDNLKKHLVSPMKMELFIANVDGSQRRQLTRLGGANWAPNFDPTGRKIIFSSNHKTEAIPFNLFMINTDGTNLEQITYDKVFDAFAMFSYDGKKLVWCSNRNNGGTRETNIFIADWVE